jgi:hypothetical protein
LLWLADHVTKPEPGSGANSHVDRPGNGINVRSEVLRIRLHPALYKLALDRSNSGAWQSPQAFKEFAAEHGLQRAWYSLSVRLTQGNGEVLVTHVNRRPYENQV